MSDGSSSEETHPGGDPYYLIASARASRRAKAVLNHEELFGLFDLSGDIPQAGLEDLGLFYHGTRHLDRLELRVNGDLPLFLTSQVSDDNVQMVAQLTNADVVREGTIVIPRDTVAIRRVKTLAHDRLYEVIELESYHDAAVRCDVLVSVHGDFADIFELRGMKRERRGRTDAPRVIATGILFGYLGTDGRRRETVVGVRSSVAPDSSWSEGATQARQTVTPEGFLHTIVLAPSELLRLEITVDCVLAGVRSSSPRSFDETYAARRRAEQTWRESQAHIEGSNEFLNDWAKRSQADLAMLRSGADGAPVIYAGIPWFATLFGRDSIITALETLAFAPAIAAGTLRRLASLQGIEEHAVRDEQPGKIVHEVRHDEMAAAGEVPFGRYYGSVDSTPLFLVLAGAYLRRTGDLDTVAELWPHLERALQWIERYGDRDGDGYVEYLRETPRGLVNQGWKDSCDAIFHGDGRIAEPPIAPVEVQGYVYAAMRALATIARRLGNVVLARQLTARATDLQRRFHRDFWIEAEGFYALALDCEKRRCEVVTSNPGHCLYAGIVPRPVAPRVAARLMQPDMFSGWGIRTLSARERRFNPMSYHNGSVWPHDNALIAAGLRRYGMIDAALRVLTALFDASFFVDQARLPELFCGFTRREQGPPVPYPVACRPQAWAAASPFLLLQSMLGLTFDPQRSRVIFDRPALPGWLTTVVVRNLRLANGVIDVRLAGASRGASVEVLRREGALDVLVRK